MGPGLGIMFYLLYLPFCAYIPNIPILSIFKVKYTNQDPLVKKYLNKKCKIILLGKRTKINVHLFKE